MLLRAETNALYVRKQCFLGSKAMLYRLETNALEEGMI
jgi:hypothetical protein